MERVCEVAIGENESDYYYIIVSYNDDLPTFSEDLYSLRVVYSSLTIPFNINQRYYSVLSGQCAATCAMDIAAYYGYPGTTDQPLDTADHVVSSLSFIITSSGLSWGSVPYADFNITYRNGDVSTTTLRDKAVESIDNGRPMMLHYYTSSGGGGNTHWVIPVSYSSSSSSITTFTVCDPYTRNSTTSTNSTWTLSQSQSYNMSGITSFYYGYATSTPE